MRLIDADALLEGRQDHEMISTHLIWNAPTIDAVPVVRCKDCQWWDDNYRECGSPNWYPNQDGCVLQPAGMFCGWAERRTDETN